MCTATYLKGSYVIREPEVAMTCRLEIVGLKDEVSSQVYLESVTYRTGIIEHHGTGFASRPLDNTRRAPGGASAQRLSIHGVDALEGAEASLCITVSY